ncbi:MAG TPA: GWxTD domain-containing protein [Gemmatimonadales bacterium]|nr:GWxTD domain-containing protein [Gemmatimonadales bacterium]
MLALLAVFALQDTTFARAESLLAHHNLTSARPIAEHLVAVHPDDPRAHLLLGRVWYAWPTFGRYHALDEFRTAARLAPTDPEPLYWEAKVGEYLLSDEGDRVVRDAVLKIFALDPKYRDCWSLFEQVYHDAGIWRRADAALATHPDDAIALAHRAEIALALENAAAADSFAARALTRAGADVGLLLVRAQAAYLEHRDGAGEAWYDSALTLADRDTADALWNQVWMIASPAEAARHNSTDPAGARAFFQWFWAKRDPNLVTPLNERIGEHYRRLAEVRRMFRLLHPFVLFQRSPRYRALLATYLWDRTDSLAAKGLALDSLKPSEIPLPDLLAVNDTVGKLTVYAAQQLNAAGLVWLRHGRPDVWEGPFSGPSWTYFGEGEPLHISFTGIPGRFGAHGDLIVAPPRSARDARQVREILSTDATTLPATLHARAWVAFFKSTLLGNTDVYLRSAPETAAVVLRDSHDDEVVRASGAGVLVVSVPRGTYALAYDVDSAGAVGRIRDSVQVPDYFERSLGLSSLALGLTDSLGDREAVLDAMPGDLTFPAGKPLAAYAEIYGLSGDAQGVARYAVRYTFAPDRALPARLLRGAGAVVFEFTREAPVRAFMQEQLEIEPGRLPPGRYRVTLSVTDLRRNVKSETVLIVIQVR